MLDIQAMLTEATEAANAAGTKWLAEAKPKYAVFSTDLFGRRTSPDTDYLLDLCGGAYLTFRDKRSSAYKAFKKAGEIRSEYSATIDIDHKFRGRQEHGLAVVCMQAAKEVLERHGLSGQILLKDYID